VTIAPGVSGFFEAKPTMYNAVKMDGVPVQITVADAAGSATVFGATGQVVTLPVRRGVDTGEFNVTVTELFTGLSTTTMLRSTSPTENASVSGSVRVRDANALTKFAGRKHVALTIALTPAQQRDATLVAQARSLADFYRKQGRIVADAIATVAPGGIIESLQPLKCPHRYPQWKTMPADLVLFGTPASNVLLLDQARGQLFPTGIAEPPAGEADVIYTRSPFVGEYDVVNVIASDATGVTAAVGALTSTARTAAR
jgi:hypothetical protein